MTQEEKELLLKELCARLPYGVKCRINDECDITVGFTGPSGEVFPNTTGDGYSIYEDIINLYLRPMSSMTEEERKEYWSNCDTFTDPAGFTHYFKGTAAFDWLLAHHFDFRNLIEKKLALEAPADMYNLNEK